MASSIQPEKRNRKKFASKNYFFSPLVCPNLIAVPKFPQKNRSTRKKSIFLFERGSTADNSILIIFFSIFLFDLMGRFSVSFSNEQSTEELSHMEHFAIRNRIVVVSVIYACFLFDNILLTVIGKLGSKKKKQKNPLNKTLFQFPFCRTI